MKYFCANAIREFVLNFFSDIYIIHTHTHIICIYVFYIYDWLCYVCVFAWVCIHKHDAVLDHSEVPLVINLIGQWRMGYHSNIVRPYGRWWKYYQKLWYLLDIFSMEAISIIITIIHINSKYIMIWSLLLLEDRIILFVIKWWVANDFRFHQLSWDYIYDRGYIYMHEKLPSNYYSEHMRSQPSTTIDKYKY